MSTERSKLPKNDGSPRYLGVPILPLRLYLNGLQQLFQVWLRPYCHPDQLGFTKGRGTNTAVQKVKQETLDSPNISELDLRRFYDSINLDYLK
jgi:RNA-directed DNA polymerase